MNIWLTNVVLSFVIAALIAGLVIPKILLIAFRKNLFDEIDERKIHHGTVPRLGGLAFTPVIYFTLALLIGCNMVIGLPDILDRVSGNIIPLTFGFCALTLIYVTGIESRPLWKPMHTQPVYRNSPAYLSTKTSAATATEPSTNAATAAGESVSEHLFRTGLCLPSGPHVTDTQIHRIVENIKNSILK